MMNPQSSSRGHDVASIASKRVTSGKRDHSLKVAQIRFTDIHDSQRRGLKLSSIKSVSNFAQGVSIFPCAFFSCKRSIDSLSFAPVIFIIIFFYKIFSN